jgi:lysophospholipase L1-like esterase
MPISMPMSSKEKTYLALGDSYTIGEAVSEPERWAVQLRDLLVQDGHSIPLPRIIAQTGWTTAELSEAIQKEKITDSYHLVSLLIGVNNQYRGQSVDVYQQEFRKLLEMAIGFACNIPHRVLVLSIPDWGLTPFAQDRDQKKISREIDLFNAVAEKEAGALNAHFLDITPISRAAAFHPELLAADHLHYSGIMYHKWALLALPVAKQILLFQ